ncbi:MAG TPA: hypothetical protein VEU62_12890 [Bryobacterales bacterium]|nr:hypothetical protein [Bryobacterales bacterium]
MDIQVSMDFERAAEHLLALHAKGEARMDRADARMDRFEKQLAEMWKLMRAGAKLVVQIGKAQKRADQRVDRLAQIWSRQGQNGGRRSS